MESEQELKGSLVILREFKPSVEYRHPRQYDCICVKCKKRVVVDAAGVDAGIITDCGNHEKSWRVKDPDKLGRSSCKYTEGVWCSAMICAVCGHCPETAKRRIAERVANGDLSRVLG